MSSEVKGVYGSKVIINMSRGNNDNKKQENDDLTVTVLKRFNDHHRLLEIGDQVKYPENTQQPQQPDGDQEMHLRKKQADIKGEDTE